MTSYSPTYMPMARAAFTYELAAAKTVATKAKMASKEKKLTKKTARKKTK